MVVGDSRDGRTGQESGRSRKASNRANRQESIGYNGKGSLAKANDSTMDSGLGR